MAELAALNVRINGDATGLRTALQSAENGLERVSAQAQATARQTAVVSGGMNNLGAVFSRNGFAISNAANQFSDLAVQMQMGVPASRALSQQLPQMTAFMGPLANITGVFAGVLIGVAGSFLTAGENATTYQQSLESLEGITSRMNSAADILSMSLYDLTVQYGNLAIRVRELAQEELQLLQIEAQRAFSEQIEALRDLDMEYRRALRSGRDFRGAMQNIERDFGLTGDAAIELARAMNAVATAETPQAQVDAMGRLRAILEENNIELSQIPPELQDAVARANALEQAIINVEAAAVRAAQAGAELTASLPMNSEGFGPGLIGPDGQLRMPPASPEEEGQPRRGGGGGGGRGMSLAEQLERDLEQLREGFASQEEIQLEAYQRQQDILQQALDQRLVTQEEYARLMEQANAQHQDRMAAIDVYRYGSGVQQAQQFMGDMARALQNGNEEMARISRVFAAGESLINAWRAFNQVLADPTLPFFAKIPAGLSVLAAGMNAVQAISSMSSTPSAASAASSVSRGGGGGGAAQAAPAARMTQNVLIDMVGASPSQIGGVQQLVDMLVEANRQGYDLNAVVRGA